MSKTRYESDIQVIETIDKFIAKRDNNLKLANRFEAAGNWFAQQACKASGSVNHILIEEATKCRDDATILRSKADYEDRVTIPKLKAKLAEIRTAPLPGVTDATVAKK